MGFSKGKHLQLKSRIKTITEWLFAW